MVSTFFIGPGGPHCWARSAPTLYPLQKLEKAAHREEIFLVVFKGLELKINLRGIWEKNMICNLLEGLWRSNFLVSFVVFSQLFISGCLFTICCKLNKLRCLQSKFFEKLVIWWVNSEKRRLKSVKMTYTTLFDQNKFVSHRLKLVMNP